MKVRKICPFCKKEEMHKYSEDEVSKYAAGEAVIKAMPNRNDFEREFIISGMCFSCQSETFHKPMPGESWGGEIGECPVCGCSVYKRDGSNGVYRCAICHAKLKEEDGVLVECTNEQSRLIKAVSFGSD